MSTKKHIMDLHTTSVPLSNAAKEKMRVDRIAIEHFGLLCNRKRQLQKKQPLSEISAITLSAINGDIKLYKHKLTNT